MPRTCPRPSYQAIITYSCLLTCFDVGRGSFVDHASGGVGGVLASLSAMVKECWGSSFPITPPSDRQYLLSTIPTDH